MPSLAMALRTLARAFSVTRMPLAGACATGDFCSVAVVIRFFRPCGALSHPAGLPRLAPLRQAQGKLWAAFLRRFSAWHATRVARRSRPSSGFLFRFRGYRGRRFLLLLPVTD